jgi:hypothetical protein
MRSVRRISQCVIAVLTVLLSVPGPVGAATEQLPDLIPVKPSSFSTTTTSTGQRQLRFTTIVANAGAGRFQVVGSRASTSEPEMNTVTQEVFNDQGTVSRRQPTGAVMYFGGDGHNHWHVRDLETYELVRTDNGVKVGTGEKHGFCFYDNKAYDLSLPGAPQTPFYQGCGNNSQLQVVTGLSVGWGDRYAWRLPDQYIDITGLTPGRYRLFYKVDVANHFLESSDTNNTSCTTLQIDAQSVSVINRRCSGS